MSQEATILAVDNSDYMRNGDFTPTRLQAQNDAVNLICQCKRQANPENTVGLVSLANTEVLCTLTCDVSKVYNRLHMLYPKGGIKFCTSLRIAHLALRHRQLRHQKMRIVCFVGSPITDETTEIVKLAKRLKKEKVNIDVVNFGENETNQSKLQEFIDTVNGKDGTGSHLVNVPPGTMLHDSLVTSPVIAGADGASNVPRAGLGMDFDLDLVDDPDLAYALRVSMEDQRMRQEQEATAHGGSAPLAPAALPGVSGTTEEDMLRQALAMSMNVDAPTGETPLPVNLANMSEDDQIAYALHMSMQPAAEDLGEEKVAEGKCEETVTLMDVDDAAPAVRGTPLLEATANAALSSFTTASTGSNAEKPATEEDNAEFLQSVLQQLPGVDAQNEDVRNAFGLLMQASKAEEEKKDDENVDDEPNK